MTAAQFLIDTSALARLMRPGAESFGWDQAAAAGLIAVCPVTELEFFYSARSAADRERGIADFRSLFGWVPVHDRAFARAWEVQGELTTKGQHRSAGPVDLVVAATAELHELDAAAPRPRLRRDRAGHRPARPLVRRFLGGEPGGEGAGRGRSGSQQRGGHRRLEPAPCCRKDMAHSVGSQPDTPEPLDETVLYRL